MYEQVLESLIERYRSQGLSVDRVLLDPAYRSMPMPEKIKVIVKYGNAIKAGQKVDGTFWKDLGLGVAGTAYLAYPVLRSVMNIMGGSFKNGIAKAETNHNRKVLFDQIGDWGEVDKQIPAPSMKPTLPDRKDVDTVLRTMIAGGVTTSSLNKARQAYKIRQTVKKFLSDKEPITQAQAIEVVSRTL